jgi:hypothetical protein
VEAVPLTHSGQVQGHRQEALPAGGRGLRLAGHLRVPGGKGHPLRHQAQGEQQPLPEDRTPDDQAGGKAFQEAGGAFPLLFLPGGIMGHAEKGRSQGGVASG